MLKILNSEPTQNQELIQWVKKVACLTEPKNIYWCDGSAEEYTDIANTLIKSGCAIRLNPDKWPNSLYFRTQENDVARVEKRTFICSTRQEDAGPTNNWVDPIQMKQELNTRLKGVMHGRTMYVIPFSMGPLGSKLSYIGVQITDSPYVVLNMRIMTRMGQAVLHELGSGTIVRALHSVGIPLDIGEKDTCWPCKKDINDKYIVHFPETREIISFGSGYGGNALLGKKCFALRIASVIARDEGWLAEHMAIIKITNPEGITHYMTAAFPSACGKTNFSMLIPNIPGWTVETIGDDICWMRPGNDGRLYAINPEAGFFGVAPGTSERTNPNAMKTLRKGSVIFTNVGITPDGDVWWEGMSKCAPEGLIDWQGQPYDPTSGKLAAQANSRFTAPLINCPSAIKEAWDNPNGVPISAILYGGRRPSVIPLVTEAPNWKSGVLMAATIASETTAASDGKVGELTFDPSAMKPFFGYNIADYYAYWLTLEKTVNSYKQPKIFRVNWFQKDDQGYIWPGFDNNALVLKWIFSRIEGTVEVQKTPIGNLPIIQDFDFNGLEFTPEQLNKLFGVNKSEWIDELPRLRKHLEKMHLQVLFTHELEKLENEIYSMN